MKIDLTPTATRMKVLVAVLDAEPNGNGRIYPAAEVRKQLGRLQERASNGTLLGELDHPDDFEIQLKNVSHIIRNVWIEGDKEKERGEILGEMLGIVDEVGNKLMAEIEVLETPKGRELKRIMEEGIDVFFSLRSTGIQNPDGTVTLKKIHTLDAILEDPWANLRDKV